MSSKSPALVYLNGSYVSPPNATISIFDRSVLFADSVYEVTAVLDGRLVDFHHHVARLRRSLGELDIPPPFLADGELLGICRTLVEKNGVVEGTVYLQVTRGRCSEEEGECARDFLWNDEDGGDGQPSMRPTVFAFTQAKAITQSPLAGRGARVITMDDLRWGRRDIKTTQLLFSSLAKMEAKRRGKDDAWLVDPDGKVTEGTSSNAYIVRHDGTIVTRHLTNDILHGVTRSAVLRFALEAGVAVEERPFTVTEAQEAAEAFWTSSSSALVPVVEICGVPVGTGRPGPVCQRLRRIYLEESHKAAI